MIKHVMALAVVVALSACSSDSNETTTPVATPGTTTPATTTPATTTPATTTPATTTPGTFTPSGGISGVWFGQNDFGEAVMVVDASQNVYSLAKSGTAYQAVFGPASEQLQLYSHRDSDAVATATSFTLAGELVGNISYNLTAENEGQQITNSAAGTAFTMTLADLNDTAPIAIADIAGTWTAKTSFCAVACDLDLELVISASGELTGNTDFNNGGLTPLVGTATAASGSDQFLSVSFVWNGFNRTGVLYRDRNAPAGLVLNSSGPDENAAGATTKSFSATLSR